MLYFDKVSKEYDNGNKVLEDISLTIHPGELVSIVGHSGAGKTTLIKLLLAEEYPTEGKVSFHSAWCFRTFALSQTRRRTRT